MAGNKYINSNSGVLTEVTALQTSAGATDAGKIVALDDNGKLNASLGLGDKVDKVTGKSLVEDTKVTAYDAHLVDETNPHSVTAAQVGAYTIEQTNSEISTAISNLVDTSPATLDTLNELAAALGDDPNFATTVATSIGTKVTGNVAITAGTGTKVTYDAKGLVTSSTTLNATDIPSLTVSKISDFPSNVTTQGNTFNGNSQLVQTTVDGKLPAIDGSLLTGIATGSEHYSQELIPTGMSLGATWYVPSTSKIYMYVNDGTNNIWIDTSSVNTGVTKEYVDTGLAGKAAVATTYTKVEVDVAIASVNTDIKQQAIAMAIALS